MDSTMKRICNLGTIMKFYKLKFILVIMALSFFHGCKEEEKEQLLTASEDTSSSTVRYGKVGIGVSVPNDQLHVSSAVYFFQSTVTENPTLKICSCDLDPDTADCGLSFATSDAVGTNCSDETDASSWNEFTVAQTNALVVKENGNVGIGTTNPGAKLHITGDMKVDGDFMTGKSKRITGNTSIATDAGAVTFLTIDASTLAVGNGQPALFIDLKGSINRFATYGPRPISHVLTVGINYAGYMCTVAGIDNTGGTTSTIACSVSGDNVSFTMDVGDISGSNGDYEFFWVAEFFSGTSVHPKDATITLNP